MAKTTNNSHPLIAKLDYTLVFIVFLLFCASLIAIYFSPIPDNVGTPKSMVMKQLMWYVISSIVCVGVFFIDYERFKWIGWFLYGLIMMLLFGLIVNKYLHIPVPFAWESHGAYSWYNLPGIGSVQPSEFMKIALILVGSGAIIKHNEARIERSVKDDFLLLGKIALIFMPPTVFVLIQPDLGTVLVYVAIVAALLMVCGIRWRIILSLLFLALLMIGGIVYSVFNKLSIANKLLEGHQLDRFFGWVNPYKYSNEQGYQLIQSLNAIGSGQLYGRGIDDTGITLPEGYNDFIFSVISGTFGFVGASILIALFFLLIYRMISAALKTHDPFGSYVCAGIIGMLTFTIFENIGMTIQVMPITGIPLPFISYGGSSLLSNMIAIGLVLGIEARVRKYMFD